MLGQNDMLYVSEGKWVPIPKVSRFVPFGYEVDPDNENMLLPVEKELEALELAKKHIKRFSSRQVAEWLHMVTGRYISHVGLIKRIGVERTRRSKAAALKVWAERLATAQEEIRKYSEEVPGSKAKG